MGSGTWTKNLQGLLRVRTYGFAAQGLATVKNTSGSALSTGTGGNSDDLSTTKITALYFRNSSSPSYGYDGLAVVFGSGSTEPSTEDVQLQSPLSSLAYRAVTNGAYKFETGTGVITRDVKVTVQNTSASQVKIAEWGILAYCGSNNTLLYRELLDAPVTLEQFESATLEMTVTLNLTRED